MKVILFLTCLLAFQTLSSESGALTHIYEWYTKGGVLCWTDDLDRIPSMYVDSVTEFDIDSLLNYHRLTIVNATEVDTDA